MKNQLVKGYAEMKKQSAEAVEAAVESHRLEIKRLEGDCNHFSASLADAMNEVTTLRNKYQDWEEWEEEEGQEPEDENDELGKWYKDETGYREAAGVGLEYSERVKRAAAPVSGPLHDRSDTVDADDLVSAAKKAALAAALASSEASHNTKTYEKLNAPSFPKSGEMTNWMYSLSTALVAAGLCGWTKAFDQLECSSMDGAKDQIRWKRLDLSLSRALQGMAKSSGESLSEDVTLKASHIKSQRVCPQAQEFTLQAHYLDDD